MSPPSKYITAVCDSGSLYVRWVLGLQVGGGSQTGLHNAGDGVASSVCHSECSSLLKATPSPRQAGAWQHRGGGSVRSIQARWPKALRQEMLALMPEYPQGISPCNLADSTT